MEIKPPYAENMRQVYLRAMDEMARPYPSIRLPAWTNFNEFTGGFRAKEFSIFCGPSGIGKTAFLASISASLLMSGVKHYVASIETGAEDYMKRVISAMYGEDLNTGDAVPVTVLSDATARYAKYLQSGLIEFSLYDNRVSAKQLIADLTYMREQGCQIAIIDNLNFMLEVVRQADQIVEMDRVIHDLIMFCKRVDMHVFMVCHPRKTDDGRVESEYDVKGSSTAIQEAQNVFLFNRLRKEDRDAGGSPFARELKIAKMRRRGRYVGRSILFNFEGAAYVERGYRETSL